MIRPAFPLIALPLLALPLLLALGATPAPAQGRPDTTRLPCAAAQQIVVTQGAAVLTTGPTTYDRYVAGPGFCARDETAVPAAVPSADTPQCPIGFRCRPGSVRIQ